MLCCSHAALLAMIFCEVLFLPMKEGTVRDKTTRVNMEVKSRKCLKTGVTFFGTRQAIRAFSE